MATLPAVLWSAPGTQTLGSSRPGAHTPRQGPCATRILVVPAREFRLMPPAPSPSSPAAASPQAKWIWFHDIGIRAHSSQNDSTSSAARPTAISVSPRVSGRTLLPNCSSASLEPGERLVVLACQIAQPVRVDVDDLRRRFWGVPPSRGRARLNTAS